MSYNWSRGRSAIMQEWIPTRGQIHDQVGDHISRVHTIADIIRSVDHTCYNKGLRLETEVVTQLQRIKLSLLLEVTEAKYGL